MSYRINEPSGQDRTAAERNDVAKATRRRRRISQSEIVSWSYRTYDMKICHEVIGGYGCRLAEKWHGQLRRNTVY